MSDESKSTGSGRTVSFWMSHAEIAALDDKAQEAGKTRNRVCREAVRTRVGLAQDF